MSAVKDPSGKMVTQVDYMFLKYGKQQKKIVLCVVETERGEGIASVVHSKGRGVEYAARSLEFFLGDRSDWRMYLATRPGGRCGSGV